MVCSFELDQQLVQQHHLARGGNQSVCCAAVVSLVAPVLLLRALEQEGVVAALLELRDDVEQGDLAATSACGSFGWIEVTSLVRTA